MVHLLEGYWGYSQNVLVDSKFAHHIPQEFHGWVGEFTSLLEEGKEDENSQTRKHFTNIASSDGLGIYL